MKVNRGQSVSFDVLTRRLHIFGNHIVASSYCNLRSYSTNHFIVSYSTNHFIVSSYSTNHFVFTSCSNNHFVDSSWFSSVRHLVGLLIHLSKPASSAIFEEKWRPWRGEWKSLKVTRELALRIYYAVWMIGF